MTADDVLLLLGPWWCVGAQEEDPARAERLFEVLMWGLYRSAAAQAG
ncbi:hypothetical protein ACIQB5_48065 [Streptomyces sp. NPDC088560]